MVACPGWLTVLYAPERPPTAASSSQSARSRASMYWIPASGGPGATTAPPRAARPSHHGRRPMFSPGPRISPARASSARSPKASSAASSPPRLARA